MGHTVWSQRVISDVILQELRSYARALAQEDRLVYEDMLKLPFRHMGAISYASSMHVWAFLLLSIILEQEKMLISSQDAMASLERRVVSLESIIGLRDIDGCLVDGCLQARGFRGPVGEDS